MKILHDHVRLYGKDYFDKLKSVDFMEQNIHKNFNSEEIPVFFKYQRNYSCFTN